MMIAIQFIPGLMFGVEYLWEDGVIVFDIGIFRVMIGMEPD